MAYLNAKPVVPFMAEIKWRLVMKGFSGIFSDTSYLKYVMQGKLS